MSFGSDDDEPHAPAYARRVRELDNEPRAAAAIDDARARLRAAAAFDDERARDHEDAQLLDELCAELACDPETRDRVDARDDEPIALCARASPRISGETSTSSGPGAEMSAVSPAMEPAGAVSAPPPFAAAAPSAVDTTRTSRQPSPANAASNRARETSSSNSQTRRLRARTRQTAKPVFGVAD